MEVVERKLSAGSDARRLQKREICDIVLAWNVLEPAAQAKSRLFDLQGVDNATRVLELRVRLLQAVLSS